MKKNILCHEGFDYCFDESACKACKGKCCVGESGYIFLSLAEVKALAKAFGQDVDDFGVKYLRKVGYKFSLLEVPVKGGFACILFDNDTKTCKAYQHRPKQCRTFPFWEYYKSHKEEIIKECPGVC